MTNPPRPPDDEPRSQPFQPVSYDLAPEFGTPPPANNPPSAATPAAPPAPTSYPVSGGFQSGSFESGGFQSGSFESGGFQSGGFEQPSPYGPAQSHPTSGYPPPAAYPTPGQQPMAYQPAPTPPVRKGNGLKITLGVFASLFLVCAIAACVLFYPVISESGAHVSAPPTLPGGLQKQDSAEMQQVVDQMEADIRSDVGNVDEVAAGIYGDGDPQKLVVMVGVAATILRPGSELDQAFSGFNLTAEGVTMGRPIAYEPGKYGGTLKCATGTSEAFKMTMCAWADHGSLGIGVFLNREATAAAKLFKDIRETVQTR